MKGNGTSLRVYIKMYQTWKFEAPVQVDWCGWDFAETLLSCTRCPLKGFRGRTRDGVPSASLFRSPFNNVITNNLKLCFFASFVDLPWLKTRIINIGSCTTPLAAKELR